MAWLPNTKKILFFNKKLTVIVFLPVLVVPVGGGVIDRGYRQGTVLHSIVIFDINPVIVDLFFAFFQYECGKLGHFTLTEVANMNST